MITNPFQELNTRLSSIEGLLLDLKHGTLKPPPPPESYITRQEAADALHITLPTLLRWTLDGKLKGYRIGRRVLYKRNEVNQAVTSINTKGGQSL